MATDHDPPVRLQVYEFFLEHGRPPTPPEIAAALELPQERVEESLHRLAEAHVLVLATGTPYVWMANPLSALPTPFRVEARGREWFGNCIWDALGVVSMLGGSGTVRTWCPDCGEALEVTVRDSELASGEGVAHFSVPAAHWWDDIGFN